MGEPVTEQISEKLNWLATSKHMAREWLVKANGWQRLWLVGSTLWVVFICYQIFADFPSLTGYDQVVDDVGYISSGPYCLPSNSINWATTRANIWGFVALYIPLLVLVPLVSYGLGIAAAWIAEGFRANRHPEP